MSHAATNWAIKQRGLKPASKIVLWHLADCHNGHTGQCNPMQSTLADLCEMSRSTLNLHLDALEARGLITRITEIDDRTKKQRPTRYVLAFDGGREAVSENQTRAVSEKTPEPCPIFSDSRVRNSDTKNLGIEPGRRTSKARDALSDQIFTELRSILSEEAATAFIAHRKAKRATLTLRAASLIAKKLADHPNPDAVIENSIMQGWTGVFPASTPPPSGGPSARLFDLSKFGATR